MAHFRVGKILFESKQEVRFKLIGDKSRKTKIYFASYTIIPYERVSKDWPLQF